MPTDVEVKVEDGIAWLVLARSQTRNALDAGFVEEAIGALDEVPAEAGAFRDHHADLAAAGADVYGLSTQSPDDQAEAAERLHLPFPLLSDESVSLAGPPLALPTFEAGGRRRYRRLTMVIAGGVVEHVFYPVFPPDAHAGEVLGWLRDHPVRAGDDS